MNEDEFYLGSFEVTSGKLDVSDPCYSNDIWCRGVLSNVKNGKWQAYSMVENDEERNSALIVYNEEMCNLTKAKNYYCGLLNTEEGEFCVGVDSGQAGFFDDAAYQNEGMIPADAAMPEDWDITLHGRWYSHCCALTLGCDSAGILPGGVVAASGYGDGSYECRYAKDKNGEIIYAQIVFIEDDDEDDYLTPDSDGEYDEDEEDDC